MFNKKLKIVAHEIIKWLTTTSLLIPFALQILNANIFEIDIGIHF